MSQLVHSELASQFEKLPPHSMEAEKCLLGSMIICGGDRAAFAQIRAVVAGDSFFQVDHQVIFNTLCRMHDAKIAIDSITLIEDLRRQNLYEEIGGKSAIVDLLSSVPSWAHFAHYANIVREKRLLRSLIEISNEALRRAYSPADEDVAETILSQIAVKAARAAAGGKADCVHRLGDVCAEILARHEDGEVYRIPTGFHSLDAMIGGFAKGEKVIVGGKPGMGKSALIKVLAKRMAEQGWTVGIISIEEGRHKIGENLLSAQSGIRNNRIAFGTAAPHEWDSIDQAATQLGPLPIFIVDSVRTVSAISAMANVLASQFKCEAIFVDHLHIIDGETNETREREISKISGELKWVWKDLNVCGIEAAQLNRAGGRERPTIENLRDSGSLGQDGDIVLLLHRNDWYLRQDWKPGDPLPAFDHLLEVIVAKNKNGAAATVVLSYDESCYSIKDLNDAVTDGDMRAPTPDYSNNPFG